MLLVFTGNGKGKTTAALGQMLRCVGNNKKVIMFQFIKGPWISGEHKIEDMFPLIKENFQIIRGGKGFVGFGDTSITIEEHKEAAKHTLKQIQEAIDSNRWDCIILDEVHNAIYEKLIETREILKIIDRKPKELLMICTGRDAPQSIIDRANIATEMRELKHQFTDGVDAKIGIEF